jgi:hypothetical protein
MRVKRSLCLALVLIAGLYSIAAACNVPVFRFALERWRAAPYRLTVLHQGPLADEQAAHLRAWMDQYEDGYGVLEVRALDVAEPSAENDAQQEQPLLAAAEQLTLPALVLQYPRELGHQQPIWQSAWNGEADALAPLVSSPVRTQLAQRLASGETAVWLVVESGDAAQDEAVKFLLAAELKRLEQELKLPELGEDEDELTSSLPLRVAFSVLAVPRDSAEAALVAMLVHCEGDLTERTDPLVFPVFGRGRALLPLVGAGITAENIAQSAEFLVGACSCEVKEQNPGFDLLLTAEWDALLGAQGVDVAALQTKAAEKTGPLELVPIPAGANHMASEESHDESHEGTATGSAGSHVPSASSNPATGRFVAWGAGLGLAMLLVLGLWWGAAGVR